MGNHCSILDEASSRDPCGGGEVQQGASNKGRVTVGLEDRRGLKSEERVKEFIRLSEPHLLNLENGTYNMKGDHVKPPGT